LKGRKHYLTAVIAHSEVGTRKFWNLRSVINGDSLMASAARTVVSANYSFEEMGFLRIGGGLE
jgi:hypothetical protein